MLPRVWVLATGGTIAGTGVYGDAAVVTGLVTRSGTNKGAAYQDQQVLFTDTYVRRDGRWQCVASQGTLVAAQQK